jgi:hypothetical protein
MCPLLGGERAISETCGERVAANLAVAAIARGNFSKTDDGPDGEI